MAELNFCRYPLLELPKAIFQAWLKFTQEHAAFQNPFFSPHFALAVARACPDDCFVTVMTKHDLPVGFFPFQFSGKRLGRAERIGRHLSDYNGVITAEQINLPMLSKLLAASGIHQYSFDHLHPSQEALGLPGEFIREGCAIDLQAGFQPYWAGLEKENPKIVKDTIRRSQKMARERGETSFQFHSNEKSDLESLINLKRNQYQSTGVKDSLGEKWVRDALLNLHQIDSPDFKASLSKFTAGDKLVSLHLGLFANGTLHFWFPIYKPEFSEYSPGRLLFYNLIQNSGTLGIQCIDRGMGAQRHKADFANRTYKLGVGTFRRLTPQCFILRAQDFLHFKRTERARALESQTQPG